MDLHAVDHRREFFDQLRHQRIELTEIADQDSEFIIDLVDTVNSVECRAQGKTDRNVVAVLLPIKVAANGPEEVLEIGDVIAQLRGYFLHFLGLTDHLVSDAGELRHVAVHAPHSIHGFFSSSACLSMSSMRAFWNFIVCTCPAFCMLSWNGIDVCSIAVPSGRVMLAPGRCRERGTRLWPVCPAPGSPPDRADRGRLRPS